MNAQTTLMAPMTMAVPCKKCGELFDLSYDLEDGSADMDEVMSVLRSKLTRKMTLCWKCRGD